MFIREFSNQRFDKPLMLCGHEDEIETKLETLFKDEEQRVPPFFGHRSHRIPSSNLPDLANLRLYRRYLAVMRTWLRFSIFGDAKADLVPDQPILALDEILEP